MFENKEERKNSRKKQNLKVFIEIFPGFPRICPLVDGSS